MASVSHLHRRAVIMLAWTTLLWALSFSLGKTQALLTDQFVAQLEVSPGSWLSTAAVIGPRFLYAAIVVMIWKWRTLLGVTPSEWKQALGLGFFSGCGMLFQMDGLQHTSASTSAFLTSAYVVAIPLWVGFVRRRVPSVRIIVACVIAAIGTALLANIDFRALTIGRGELETLIASGFFMAQILWLERPEFARNDIPRMTAVMFAIIGVMASSGVFIFSEKPVELLVALNTSLAWQSMSVVLVLLCTVAAFILMNTYQRHVTATEAGLIYTLEPVFASVFALFFPALLSALFAVNYANEVLGAHVLIGGALLTGANVLAQLPSKRASA